MKRFFQDLFCRIQSIWIFLCHLTCYVLLEKTCCYIINIKFSAKTCCTRGPRGNHVSKVYFMVKKQKNAAKTLQQNQTNLILLQYFCSIFLLQKLKLLQQWVGHVQHLISMRSAARFCCVWMKNALCDSWAEDFLNIFLNIYLFFFNCLETYL